MAFTERYVTVAGAGAHDGTSEANAWTFAEMIAAAPGAGVRVNMKSGSYSIGATTLPTGSVAAPFVIRGYNTSIGDLDNLGRNADGTLVTTNMPDVTITAAWTPGPFGVLQNLDVTGAISNPFVSSSSVDNFTIISCNFLNTQNNAAARCISLDNDCTFINCDFACSGAAHASVVDADGNTTLVGCRLKTNSSAACLTVDNGTMGECVFYGNTGADGVVFGLTTGAMMVSECTFYNLDACIQTPNSVNVRYPIVWNNQATGCAKWIESLYSATATIGAIVAHNRTRDITTMLTGIEEVNFGAVTTAGTDADDYVNAGAGNFRLANAAPAISTGLIAYSDIGAYQKQPVGGGGSNAGFLIM